MMTRRWRTGRTRWTASRERCGSSYTANVRSDHVRVEASFGREGDPQVLSTDAAGGVLWIDVDGDNHRQVIRPDGRLARDAEWLSKLHEKRPEPD